MTRAQPYPLSYRSADVRRSNRPTPVWRIVGSLLVLAIAAILLFARLGHYALWDDEAMTALTGEGVWRTGDTTAVIGHNLMAYHNGMILSPNLKTRYESPLEYYVAAPFAGLWPGSALAVRMPFAILGFLTVGLILWWMHRDKVSSATWVLMAMGLIANVSFWLFCRQCRYYSLCIFLSTAIAYLYLHYENRRWVPAMIGIASAALFASNYLIYAAVYGAIGVDWLIWGRKSIQPGWRGWLWIWGPQVLLNVPVFWIWCPLFGSYYGDAQGRVVINHFVMFWWCLRDMDTCQFGVLLLVCAAPLLWFWRRDRWLLRAPLAALVYLAAVALLSPQRMWVVMDTGQWVPIGLYADVRFLCPLILLFIAIAALVIRSAGPVDWWWLMIPVAAVVFFTDAMHVGPLFAPGPRNNSWSAGSTPLSYAEELLYPPTDPYTVVAAWINANISKGQTIFVLPDYMCYPLMFHAPKAVYGWQLAADKRSEYPTLPAIDFQNVGVPDYLIVFGKGAPPGRTVHLPNHYAYEIVKLFDVYGQDVFRPELFSRSFQGVVDFDRTAEGIRIYKCAGREILHH